MDILPFTEKWKPNQKESINHITLLQTCVFAKVGKSNDNKTLKSKDMNRNKKK